MKEPKIRFKGFQGEWEIEKIGNFSTSFSGGTPTAGISAYYGGNIPFIRSGEIHEDKTELSLTEKGYNNSSAKIVEKGTLLYALYGATSGDVAISKIRGAINQAILAIIPYKSVETDFLADFLLCNKNKIVGELLQGGQGNLSGSLVKDINVTYPCLSEQRAIASYFQNLDALIQSITKKIESLKQVKAASLQSMFPQEGETTPRVRFKGFEGEWEINSLSTFLTPSNLKNRDYKFTKEDVLSVSGEFGIVNQIAFQGRSFAGVSVANYGVVEHKDIVYTKSPLKTNPYGIIKTNEGDAGIVSTLYAVYKCANETNPTFVQYYFDLDSRINSYLRPLVRKGAKNDMKVSSKDALLGNVIFPTYEEQQKIASYFTTLDRQITLQTQRLEKLKQIKSACLDEMFV